MSSFSLNSDLYEQLSELSDSLSASDGGSNTDVNEGPNSIEDEAFKFSSINNNSGFTFTACSDRTTTMKRRSTYKHIPHSEKPTHLVEKRNARERKRVMAVNDAFLALRKHVPCGNRTKRISKVKTLKIAIDYIYHLQDLIEEHDTKLSTDYTTSRISDNVYPQTCYNSESVAPDSQQFCKDLLSTGEVSSPVLVPSPTSSTDGLFYDNNCFPQNYTVPQNNEPFINAMCQNELSSCTTEMYTQHQQQQQYWQQQPSYNNMDVYSL